MFQGYKTVVFNCIMAIVAVVHALNPDAEAPTTETVSQGVDIFLAGLAAVWAIGAVILRAVTNSPIFKKKEPQEQK